MITRLPDGLYRVVTKRFVAGFVVERGRVTECAPILRKRLDEWLRYDEPVVTRIA